MPRHGALPPSLPPRGICREAVAEYIGVSPGKFDEMVSDGRMPEPKEIDSRRVWDLHEVDKFFSALPRRGKGNPWDRDIST